MKHFKFLFTFFLLLCSVVTNAYDVIIGGVYYNYTATNELEVTYGENPYSGSVVIPMNVVVEGNTYVVTSIGNSAFEECVDLTSIEVPGSVKRIGMHAFNGCDNLSSVYITDISAWCNINFNIDPYESVPVRNSSNPLIYADALYLNGELVTDLVIPDNVTMINRFAFFAYRGLESVEVSNSVTDIGEDAFCRCANLKSAKLSSSMTIINQGVFSRTGLTSITIPEGVKTLGTWSFDNCPELTTVVLPSTLTRLGDYAFEACTNLSEITLPESLTFIGKDVFVNTALYNNQTGGVYLSGWLLGYNGELAGEYVIADGTKYIADNVFHNYSGLTSIEIPNSVTIIGNYAFAYCTGLKSVRMGNGITSIGERAFYNCSGLTSIEIPNSVTSIGDYAFYDCSGLVSVVIPNSLTSIEYSAFRGCTSLGSIEIPNSVTSIGGNAFEGCSNLAEVHITDLAAWCNIDYDGYYACPLYYADKLYLNGELVTELVIPDGVTEVRDYAFYGLPTLASVAIPNSVTNIGERVFEDCSSLASVTIPNSVTNIGKSVFKGCSGLTNLTIGNGVANIGDNAFYGCSNLAEVHITDLAAWCNIDYDGYYACPSYYADKLYLNGELVTELVIPDGVTEVRDYAFYGFFSLASVAIPNSVTNIGERVFEDCSSLASVTIPNSVTNIGKSVFKGCSGLTNLTIGNGVANIGDNAFYGCSNLAEVHITDLAAWCNIDFESDYSNPILYSNSLYLNGELVTELVIPNGVTEIKDYAFTHNRALTSVVIPNSVVNIGDFAFDVCTALKELTIGNGVTSIGENAFNCRSLACISSYIPAEKLFEVSCFASTTYRRCLLYVPLGAKDVYASTSGWNKFVDVVEMDFTDVDEVKVQRTEEKVIYDLYGRKVDAPVKGVYIVNGKQTLFK